MKNSVLVATIVVAIGLWFGAPGVSAEPPGGSAGATLKFAPAGGAGETLSAADIVVLGLAYDGVIDLKTAAVALNTGQSLSLLLDLHDEGVIGDAEIEQAALTGSGGYWFFIEIPPPIVPGEPPRVTGWTGQWYWVEGNSGDPIVFNPSGGPAPPSPPTTPGGDSPTYTWENGPDGPGWYYEDED